MSLVMAGLLLTAGVFIGDIIKHPDWLVKIRGILRLVLVSSGAAVPAFVISAFVAVFIVKHQSSPYPTIPVLSLVFFCSLMPAWLLVQTGYRMLANRANTISLHLVQETSVRLCIRSLKNDRVNYRYHDYPKLVSGATGIGGKSNRLFWRERLPCNFRHCLGPGHYCRFDETGSRINRNCVQSFRRTNCRNQTDCRKTAGENRNSQRMSDILVGTLCFRYPHRGIRAAAGTNAKIINLQNILQTPSAKHLLGTDQLGRDILSRLLAGIRTELLIGLAVAVVVSIIAIGWAMLSARCKRMNNWRGDKLGRYRIAAAGYYLRLPVAGFTASPNIPAGK